MWKATEVQEMLDCVIKSLHSIGRVARQIALSVTNKKAEAHKGKLLTSALPHTNGMISLKT